MRSPSSSRGSRPRRRRPGASSRAERRAIARSSRLRRRRRPSWGGGLRARRPQRHRRAAAGRPRRRARGLRAARDGCSPSSPRSTLAAQSSAILASGAPGAVDVGLALTVAARSAGGRSTCRCARGWPVEVGRWTASGVALDRPAGRHQPGGSRSAPASAWRGRWRRHARLVGSIEVRCRSSGRVHARRTVARSTRRGRCRRAAALGLEVGWR